MRALQGCPLPFLVVVFGVGLTVVSDGMNVDSDDVGNLTEIRVYEYVRVAFV